MKKIIQFTCCLYILLGIQACQDSVKKSESSSKGEEAAPVFTNPVVNRDFRDPTVIKAENGSYTRFPSRELLGFGTYKCIPNRD